MDAPAHPSAMMWPCLTCLIKIRVQNFIKIGQAVAEEIEFLQKPVTDSWAGAVMQKPLGIQKCDQPTDLPTYRPTNQHGKV